MSEGLKAKVVKPSKLTVQLVTHREVAEACSVDTETLRDWVAKGEFPEPHSVIERTWFYRVDVVAHWLETGEWPRGARFKPGEGKGRQAEDSPPL